MYKRRNKPSRLSQMGYLFLGKSKSKVNNKKWTVLDLFRSGEQGAWYDPSDWSTLFQDSAGTTPVTDVGQPVGLMLDKSKGLVLGGELVTNGDFSGGTAGWSAFSAATTVSNVGGRLRVEIASGAFGDVVSNVMTTVIGRVYAVTATLFSLTGTSAHFYIGNSFGGSGPYTQPTQAAPNPFTAVFTATATTTYFILETAGSVGQYSEWDNISVRELPGSHCTQRTAINRPLLSARVNLLTKTEDFADTSQWGINQNIILSKPIIAGPAGVVHKLVANTANSQHHVQGVVGGRTGSIYLKAAELNFAYWYWAGSASYINLTTGAVTIAAGVAPVVAAAGDGWWRVSTDIGSVASPTYFSVGCATAAGVNSFAGDGVSGIYATAPQCEASPSATRYQRVNTATDYDSVGFPAYLAFNGTNSWMSTGSIDFSQTDKMTICAGVRKLGTTTGVISELSGNADSSPGVFSLAGDATAANQWFVKTVASVVGAGAQNTSSPHPSPVTDVLTAGLDMAGLTLAERTTLRVNAVGRTTYAGAVSGTGNYGNYPLFIGSRAGTSLFLNGQIYSLVIRAALSSDSQILALERFANSKTGAY